MRSRLAYLLCFGSGVAGLVYEIAWTRQFGSVFGSTVQSLSFVTAIYMFGLGVGGWLFGRRADRGFDEAGVRRVGAGYAKVEIAIGVLGAVLALVFTHLGPLSALVSSYTRSARGWYEPSLGAAALRLAIASVLLAPSTLLLGGTLPLLVRAIHRDAGASPGATTGLVYGVNTAGAALGALASDLWLLPRVGLLRTQLVASALDVAVGIAALALFRGATSAIRPPPASSEGTPRLGGAAFALFASGFAALGLELVWFRILGSAFGAYRPVLSILLATILAGLFIGSIAGARVARSGPAPHVVLGASQAGVAVVSLVLLGTLERSAFVSSSEPALIAHLGAAAPAILALVLAPSVLMGFSFPLVTAAATDERQLGARVGQLYLANTAGSVAGATLAGFAFLPTIGAQATAIALAAIAAIAPAPLLFARRANLGDRARLSLVVALAVVVPLFAVALALPSTFLLQRWLAPLPADARVLAVREGVSELVVVTEEDGKRMLYTNGHPMSGTSLFGQRYMRAFAHLPLLMQAEPERALVICFGVGNTAHAASLHRRLRAIEIADLSKNVLEHAGWFSATNHDVLADPRVTVYVDDGRQHLRTIPEGTYDLVTLEPPPIAFAGVAALYSKEFYELARSRLRSGGMITQWLPAYQVPSQTNLAIIRAFLETFPSSTVLLSGERSELILLGERDGTPVLDLDRFAARLASEPAVAADLRHVRLGTLTEIAGMFVADADTLFRATTGIAPVTDDLPSTEYAFVTDTSPMEIPSSIFALDRSRTWCPTCWTEDRPTARVRDLDRYFRVLGAFYATRAFLTTRYPITIEDPTGDLGEVIARSDYLRAILQ